MGPSTVGKTSLLGCLGEALGAQFLPEEKLSKLIEELRNGKAEGSTRDEEYVFHLEQQGDQKRCWCMDGPGGAWLDTSTAKDVKAAGAKLLAKARRADSLIIVLDASGNKRETLDQVCTLLSKIVQEVEVPVASPSKFQSIFKSKTAQTVIQRRVKAERVVLMLNKADQYAVRRIIEDQESQQTPLELLDALDPIEHAEKILGVNFLNRVWAFLRPNAKLAISFASAGGFYEETGAPRLDETGAPTKPEQEHGPADYLPYGVRDSLLYAAFKYAESGSSVRELGRPKL